VKVIAKFKIFFLKYIQYHSKFLFIIYLNLILTFNKNIFSFFFNITTYLRRVDTKIKYLKKTDLYFLKSKSNSMYIAFKERAELYLDGIDATGRAIGKDYHLDYINFNKGDTIVDCGANVGNLLLYFSEIKTEINYIGIEPSPRDYECLKKNSSSNYLYNIGLWHEKKTIPFFLAPKQGDSSFIKPTTYDSILEIPAVRLDGFIDKKIKLFKLEAEGAEPEVLMGSQKLLKNTEYISADLGFERGIEKKSTIAEVINYLLNNNFEMIKMSHDRIVVLFKNKNFNK